MGRQAYLNRLCLVSTDLLGIPIMLLVDYFSPLRLLFIVQCPRKLRRLFRFVR